MSVSTQPPAAIPHIIPARYDWSLHLINPKIHLRRALGPETKWARQAPSTRQLYLTGRITLVTSPSSESFYRAVRIAWLRLRFLHPEIVQRASGTFDEDGGAIMQIEIPRDEVEAQEWLGRTLRILEGKVGNSCGVSEDGMDVFVEEVEFAFRSDGRSYDLDPVSVCWYPVNPFPSTAPAKQESVTGAAVSMRVDHGLADGMGAFLLLGKYLALMAEEIDIVEQNKGESDLMLRLNWAKATKRIPKPWVQMMDERQRIGGEAFEEGVRENTELVLGSMRCCWGIPFRPDCTDYEPRSKHITLPPSKSRIILQSVKRRLGTDYNITHLAHAAFIMMLLRCTPAHLRPLDEQPHLISPLFMNGRKYLDATQPKAKDHVPMCRAISAVEFRDVAKYIMEEGEGRETIWGKMRAAVEETRREYARMRGMQSLLSEAFGIMDIIATAKNDIPEKAMADVYFLSDGIVEQYTSASYSTRTSTQVVLALDDIRFTANPDGPPLIIRMSSFRDRIRFSAEWNGTLYEESTIEEFLNGVVGLVESVVE